MKRLGALVPEAWRRLAHDLRREIRDDALGQGAAALAFYWMLALFPAAIFLLTLIAYLPIPHLERAVLHFARATLPADAGALLSSFVDNVLLRRRGGLLSFGAVLTVWSTSGGIHALMHQLNVAWDAEEKRPFWKRRAVAMLIAMCFVLLVIAAFGLIVFGRALHLRLLRWLIVCAALNVGIALIYHYGPSVRRRFRLVTPGTPAGAGGPDRGVGGISDVRGARGQLQHHLRLARRRHHADAVALPGGVGHPARRRARRDAGDLRRRTPTSRRLR